MANTKSGYEIYVEAYAQSAGITVEEAEKLEIVQQVKKYYEEGTKGNE